jgi:hypothetical protein
MGTTPNRGIPYPENSDLVTNGAAAMQAIAEALDGLPEVAVPAAANFTSSSTARRVGDMVDVVVALVCTGAVGGNVPAAVVPAGYRPAQTRWLVGVDINTGGSVTLSVNANGEIRHVFSRAVGDNTGATVSYSVAGS